MAGLRAIVTIHEMVIFLRKHIAQIAHMQGVVSFYYTGSRVAYGAVVLRGSAY